MSVYVVRVCCGGNWCCVSFVQVRLYLLQHCLY